MAFGYTSTSIPPAPLDAFEGAEMAPSGPSSSYSTYSAPEWSYGYSASHLDSTIPIHPTYYLPTTVGAGGSPSAPNYYNQNPFIPLTNFTPNTVLPAHSDPSLSLDMYDTSYTHPGPWQTYMPNNLPQGNITPGFADMQSSPAASSFLPSEQPFHHHFQASQSPFQEQPIHYPQAPALPPQLPFQIQASAYTSQLQLDAASNAVPAVAGVPHQTEEQENRPVELQFQPIITTVTRRHKKRSSTKEPKEKHYYFCEACQKRVLVHRKKFHDMVNHNPENFEWICRICQVLGKEELIVSRKDALKRHVKKSHGEYKSLLPCILVPRKQGEHENLEGLRQAMRAINSEVR